MKPGTPAFFTALVCLLMVFSACSESPSPEESQVCFNQHCFRVELAATPEERARGLMYRESLSQDRGMLFIFEHKTDISIWMRNTLIPLDIIWLDESLVVVDIKENVQPCTTPECPIFQPQQEAIYVLELNAGKAREVGLSIGDVADFRLS